MSDTPIKDSDPRYVPGVSEIDDDMTDTEWTDAFGPAQARDLASSYNIDTVSAALAKMDTRYSAGAWKVELTHTMEDDNVNLPMAVMIAVVDNAADIA